MKNDWPGWIQGSVAHVAKHYGRHALSRFLGPDVALVPAPGHAPLVSQDALWVGRRICQALVGVGLGCEVELALERVSPVQPAHFAKPGGRPSALRHFETIQVQATELPLIPYRAFVVVDDFITKGATMLGAISRLQEAFPAVPVLGFALVRTCGLTPDVEKVFDPCVGTVTLDRATGEVHRSP